MSKTLRQFFDEQEVKQRIIFPLDCKTVQEAIDWVLMLKDHVGMFKIGFELQQQMLADLFSPPGELLGDKRKAVAFHAQKVFELAELVSRKLFWDGKFHDIPNTVGGASKAAGKMGVKMFNVHASGDLEALKEAVANRGEAFVLGVTVLTTITPERCGMIYGMSNICTVLEFVDLVLEAGAHGVISSPLEVEAIRADERFDKLALITPGVRPSFASLDDQKRVMTPFEAIKAGADALVIGRPIAKHFDPIEACKLISEEIERGLVARQLRQQDCRH